MKRFLCSPVFWIVLVYSGACLLGLVFGDTARAERPVLLPRHAATQPADVRAVETIQRIYLSDGTVQEKSLGVVTLGAGR